VCDGYLTDLPRDYKSKDKGLGFIHEFIKTATFLSRC